MIVYTGFLRQIYINIFFPENKLSLKLDQNNKFSLKLI